MTKGKRRSRLRCAHPGCGRKLDALDAAIATCRCGQCFCKLHRLPEAHDCPVSYKIDKAQFVADNKCVADKVAKA